MTDAKPKMGRPPKHKPGELEVLTITLPKAYAEWLRTLYKGHISQFMGDLVEREMKRKPRKKKEA